MVQNFIYRFTVLIKLIPYKAKAAIMLLYDTTVKTESKFLYKIYEMSTTVE